jgi:hypothetical protein
LQNKYLVTPYAVGKDKKSLAMVLPSKVVKSLRVNPLSVFLLLRTNGLDEINLKIIREEDLTKKDIEKTLPAGKVSRPSQQESSSGAVPEFKGGEGY